MVDLKHLQPGMRIAVSEGVEPSSQDNVLPHALRESPRKLILGIPAARRHERPERPRKRVVLFRIGSQLLFCFGTNDAQSQGIVEHSGLVKKLVRGAPNRHPLCSSAEGPLLHRSAPQLYVSVPSPALLHSS